MDVNCNLTGNRKVVILVSNKSHHMISFEYIKVLQFCLDHSKFKFDLVIFSHAGSICQGNVGHSVQTEYNIHGPQRMNTNDLVIL